MTLNILPRLNQRATANIILVGLGALEVFHILILLSVLPGNMAWGGRTETTGTLIFLEVIAFIVTLLFAAIIAAKAGYLGSRRAKKLVSVAIWFVFGYFVLNIIGNLASTSPLERAVFTPVSMIFALLALKLALNK